MPSTTLDDGGWGAIASNFANALAPDPSKQARTYLMGAQYQKLLLEQEEMRRRMEAVRQSIENYPNTLPPNASMPLNADGTPQVGPVSPDMQREHTTRRQQQILDNAAATSLAKSASDYAQGVHANRGLGAIAGGIPRDPRQQDVIQTQISTIGGSLPNYSASPHTFQSTDASGTAVGAPITSRRIPEGPAALASPIKVGPEDPFASDPAGQKFLADLQRRVSNKGGGDLSRDEIERAGIIMDKLHPVTVEHTDINGRPTQVEIRKTAISQGLGGLAGLVDDYRKGFAPGAPPRPPGFGMNTGGAPAPAPAPDATVGGLAGGAPAAPAAAAPGAAPAAAPGVSGLTMTGPNIRVGAPIGPMDAEKLRTSIEGNKVTQNYATTMENWESMVQALKQDSKAADIGIIFAAAKVLDPPSVVRGPEGEMLQATGGYGDRLLGYLNSVQGGARLSEGTRADLALMVKARVDGTAKLYFAEKERWTEIARQGGLSPDQIRTVIPSYPPPTEFDLKDINKQKGVGKSGSVQKWEKARAAKDAATAPAPATGGGRTIRVNPQTGAIEDVR